MSLLFAATYPHRVQALVCSGGMARSTAADDYPWATRFRYDAPQIEAQKKAVVDSNSLGWMMWNAGSLFRRGGLAPK